MLKYYLNFKKTVEIKPKRKFFPKKENDVAGTSSGSKK
jgi:hypothetical protein